MNAAVGPAPRTTRRRATDASLTKARILEATLGLIDRHGVDGLSMRTLAAELGVFPTAIYWHVPTRNDLISGAVALALGGVSTRLPATTWRRRLAALLARFRDAVRAHPNLAPVIGHQLVSNSPLDLPMLEFIVQALEDAGFAGRHLVDAFNVFVAALCGFVTLELAALPDEGADDWARAHRQRLESIAPEAFPTMARHIGRLSDKAFIVRWSSGTTRPMDAGFAAWVEVILDGLEARLARLARKR